jgi:hypothetical protein
VLRRADWTASDAAVRMTTPGVWRRRRRRAQPPRLHRDGRRGATSEQPACARVSQPHALQHGDGRGGASSVCAACVCAHLSRRVGWAATAAAGFWQEDATSLTWTEARREVACALAVVWWEAAEGRARWCRGRDLSPPPPRHPTAHPAPSRRTCSSPAARARPSPAPLGRRADVILGFERLLRQVAGTRRSRSPRRRSVERREREKIRQRERERDKEKVRKATCRAHRTAVIRDSRREHRSRFRHHEEAGWLEVVPG